MGNFILLVKLFTVGFIPGVYVHGLWVALIAANFIPVSFLICLSFRFVGFFLLRCTYWVQHSENQLNH